MVVSLMSISLKGHARLQEISSSLLALISASEIFAADYENGLAPPGAPSSAFPTPSRAVAGIVTDIWRD
jgi:hypothetical protein